MLSLSGISKSFDGRPALLSASLSVVAGEVHALLGENGAGKSTLMNVLAGIYAPDSGVVTLDGQRLAMRGPQDAIRAGIGMVHQHFRLVERFSAAENLMLAAKDRPELATRRAASHALKVMGEELGLHIDPAAIVGEVSVSERQRIEICKVLALGARIVVLDEPTAVLTDQEAGILLSAARRMAKAGKTVILITHKLREVIEHSDRVTVMRQGITVKANQPAKDLDVASLAELMVGSAMGAPRTLVPARRTGSVRLRVSGLTAYRKDGAVGASSVSLEVGGGEVLGIAGIGGNGQQQLADAIAGTTAMAGGTLEIDGVDMTTASVAARRDRGLRIIPSDRAAAGFASEMSASENLAMTAVRGGRYGKTLLARTAMHRDCARAITDYEIAGAAPDRPVRLLSGGNAQKLLLARELSGDVKVLVAHSPARGLDVKATAFVHEAIRQAAARGAACLLISEDLEEVLALADRIAVMSRGKFRGELPAGATRADIGAMMLDHA